MTQSKLLLRVASAGAGPDITDKNTLSFWGYGPGIKLPGKWSRSLRPASQGKCQPPIPARQYKLGAMLTGHATCQPSGPQSGHEGKKGTVLATEWYGQIKNDNDIIYK